MSTRTKAQLIAENEVLRKENAALHAARRPSRSAPRATEAQRNAHRTYRETLSAARELAIRTGKSVLVG